MEPEEDHLESVGGPPSDLPKSAPEWVPDKSSSSCMLCSTNFSLTNRRHHCRGCGKLLCKKCCSRFLLLPREIYPHDDPQRLCTDCYKKISIISFEKKLEAGGIAEGPTLLLIHDACYNRAAWHIQMDILSKQFRVIALDLPGHGSRLDEDLTLKSALEAVQDAITNHVPEKKALVMGMGFGGYVAMVYAGQYPEHCTGLILCGAAFNSPGEQTFYDMRTALYKMLPGQALSGVMSSMEVDGTKEPNLMVSLRYLMRAGFHYDQWPKVQKILKTTDFVMHLRSYDGKVLFVNGERDKRSDEKALLASANDSVLQVILGGDHLMYWDEKQYPELHKFVVQFATTLDLLPSFDDHEGTESLESLLGDLSV
eukprot:CAMPEP_0119140840 /NCGR_PEP_ID=MMETSP1310-20130426/29918_1 /TAXON_ID=464262 /ORGANISM="Genus nov. species nov., Strain RCC2339" /LENGTH=367 /DNA_ID=CAMNT_0007132231 /DNA_START=77 /DNA_END=1180 /DNA_ORIENTATION=-